MAGNGVFWVACRPQNTSGRKPSLAATNVILEPVRMLAVEEPNTDIPTMMGMTTKPALPNVATPNGCKGE